MKEGLLIRVPRDQLYKYMYLSEHSWLKTHWRTTRVFTVAEAEDIKRWQEYTEELYQKDLHDQDNHDGVITHLEPDIVEREVKWALESKPERKTPIQYTNTYIWNLERW